MLDAFHYVTPERAEITLIVITRSSTKAKANIFTVQPVVPRNRAVFRWTTRYCKKEGIHKKFMWVVNPPDQVGRMKSENS